jgi:hypothetical protein
MSMCTIKEILQGYRGEQNDMDDITHFLEKYKVESYDIVLKDGTRIRLDRCGN